ncbi:MAG: hypothetical protein LH474_09875 [Chamaesiphon sp.]|nr:hypothetical protein [Chamaesiphon sp.]
MISQVERSLYPNLDWLNQDGFQIRLGNWLDVSIGNSCCSINVVAFVFTWIHGHTEKAPCGISVDQRCLRLGCVDKNVAVEETNQGIQPEVHFFHNSLSFRFPNPSDVIMPTQTANCINPTASISK